MDRKIVFFDLDGTVFDDYKKIPKSTKEAIFRLQENGIYTAIATGRGPSDMEWAARELNINSYVAINGSYAIFEGKEIFLQALDQDEVLNLVDTVRKYEHSAAFMTHNDIWVLDEDHPSITSCTRALDLDYPKVEKNLHLDRPINQIVIYSEEEYDNFYKEAHPNLEFIRFHELGMDATDRRLSKAVGIRKMLEVGDFKIENSYAFGDALNDMEMISYVGCGVAMGNAIDGLKEVADYITTSNMDDGIWKACEKLGLFK